MSTLHLICGLPGSGKTTLAKELEIGYHALRLSPDEWISQLIKDKRDKDELDRLRAPVEKVMWELAQKLMASGTNVILENGFWSKQERLDYLRSAKQVDTEVKVVLHYLDVPIQQLWDRIQQRSLELPNDCFHITRAELDLWMSCFNAPDREEFSLFDGYEVYGTSHAPLIIRKVKDEDLENVLDIAVKAFTPIHQSFQTIMGSYIFQLVYPDWVESQNNYIRSLFLDHSKDNFFVAERDGQLLGFISLLIENGKDKAEIGINAVAPEYSRQGIGTQMYAFSLDYMKSKGIRLVEVSTGGDDSHLPARSAYKKAGFTTALPLVKFYKQL